MSSRPRNRQIEKNICEKIMRKQEMQKERNAATELAKRV